MKVCKLIVIRPNLLPSIILQEFCKISSESFPPTSKCLLCYIIRNNFTYDYPNTDLLGRKCLQAILAQLGWKVRILTKNTAVQKDFDLIEKHKDRVLLGLSITAPPDRTDIVSSIEPYASPIRERIAVMKEAVSRGFRVYAMFCPILPGIADAPEQIDELIRLAAEWQAEEVFAEAVNPRGRGLILTQQALKSAGFHYEAAQVESVRCKQNWSWYVVRLIKSIQHSVGKLYDISKLRFLLYPSRLEEQDLARIREDDAGVIWLVKNQVMCGKEA